MGIKAIAHRVVIRVDEPKKKSAGGIDLSALDRKMEINDQTLGVILDIGEDVYAAFKPKREFAGLQVGDRVFFAKRAGKWCLDPVTKEEVLMVNDEDIVGKYIED